MSAAIDFEAPRPNGVAGGGHRVGAGDDTDREPPPPPQLTMLGDLLDDALERADRRASGAEKPIPLPWASIAGHFGGGLWPGVHFLVAGTGVGKTALALQVALHAAKANVPTLYVGLELEPMQVSLRVIAEEAGLSWSALYTGKAGPTHMQRARAAVPAIRGLPFHVQFGQPQGWPVSELMRLAEATRARYPEPCGAGSRPFLVVLDFLQIIGADLDANGRSLDLRERIGRAAYVGRDLASRLNAVVLIVSSTARDKYALLTDACSAAGLQCDEDEAGHPIKRVVLNPDALVGLGKESGEIEFSADSVSVLARVQGTRNADGGHDVLLVTAKGRATGATWSPLHFTGHRFREPDDRGALTWEAMKSATERRARNREAKANAKQDAKVTKILADAAAIASYVRTHPRCSAREARVNAVGDNSKRWTLATAKLGAALSRPPLTIEHDRLPVDVLTLMMGDPVERGHSPPAPPPTSTPTVDGLRPTVDGGECGPSTMSTASTVGFKS